MLCRLSFSALLYTSMIFCCLGLKKIFLGLKALLWLILPTTAATTSTSAGGQWKHQSQMWIICSPSFTPTSHAVAMTVSITHPAVCVQYTACFEVVNKYQSQLCSSADVRHMWSARRQRANHDKEETLCVSCGGSCRFWVWVMLSVSQLATGEENHWNRKLSSASELICVFTHISDKLHARCTTLSLTESLQTLRWCSRDAFQGVTLKHTPECHLHTC